VAARGRGTSNPLCPQGGSVTTPFDIALGRVLRDEHEQALGIEALRMRLTDAERHVMAHATAWDHERPLYRNHFCASAGHADWATLQALCSRELMRVGRAPGPISGGDTVFVVTPYGLEALRRFELASSR
jgi:hypothetical protein